MRLLSIEINNFRQFNGRHRMDLDVQGSRNVVVIHGENGAGKTTLLNAFKWCFYDATDFDSGSDTLLNEQALVEGGIGGKITMSIIVEFEHEQMRFTAHREALFKKTGAVTYESIGGAHFALSWIDSSGSYQSSHNPETHINQILPAKMQPYFFFNGERIEKLAHANASDQIQSAIKNLMGLEIMERATLHLTGPVIARLRKELKEASPKDLSDAIENENAVSEQISETKRQIAQLDRNVAEFGEELLIVNKALENNSEVAGLQSQRLAFEDDVADLKAKLATLTKERRELISMSGGLAFSEGLLKISGEILEEKRKKGELPFKVKEQFITDLLENARCICDRDLTRDSPPYLAVSAFKSSTTSADVEDAFIQTSGTIGQMSRARSSLFAQITTFQTNETSYNDEISKKVGRIDVISHQIGERNAEDISLLENKRGELQVDIGQALLRKGGLQEALKNWEEKHSLVKREREKLSQQSAKNGAATKRLQLAEEVKRVLDHLYVALAEHVRARLSKKVDETFKTIMRKPYWAEISSDYTLQIYKDINGHKQIVYEKSTGENQITSLSFVGSIVSIAKEQSASDHENFRGGVFPIVMDSPFGALDPDYRNKIAEYIPELAEQVIIMVSESQWKGEVAQQVRPRTGKEYTLHYFTPAAKDDDRTPSVGSSDKYEYTEIKEGCYVG